MARGILVYNLDDPDDAAAHRRAPKALDYALALFSFGEFLRRFDKHRDLSAPEQALLEEIRRQWYEECPEGLDEDIQ